MVGVPAPQVGGGRSGVGGQRKRRPSKDASELREGQGEDRASHPSPGQGPGDQDSHGPDERDERGMGSGGDHETGDSGRGADASLFSSGPSRRTAPSHEPGGGCPPGDPVRHEVEGRRMSSFERAAAALQSTIERQELSVVE